MYVAGIDIPVWLLLIAFLIFAFIKYHTHTFGAFKNCDGVRGPKPWPVFGTSWLLLKKGSVQYYRDLISEYGKVVSTWSGRLPSLVIADPEIIKEITIKQFHNFTNRFSIEMGRPMNSSITMLKDEHWKHVRHLLSPVFTAGKLRKMDEPMNDCCFVLVKNLKGCEGSDNVVDVKSALGAFTMDVIAKTAFGLDIDSQSDPNNPFVAASKRVLVRNLHSPAMIVFFFFPFLLPYVPKIGINLLPKSSVDFYSNITERAMNARKGETTLRSDFLQHMISAHEEFGEDEERKKDDSVSDHCKRGLTEDEVLAQSIIFFLAGYDTVSNACTFILFNLATHEDVQERLYTEIASTLKAEEQEKPSYDYVSRLRYLDMVVCETMRIYAPPRIERIARDDITINGLHIPKGVQVTIPVDYLHHDPVIYPDPERFDPERFTEEAKAERDPVYYMPFGLGPRHCVAMRLGLMEIKMAMVHIVKNFKVQTSAETQIPISREKRSGRPQDVKLTFILR